MNKRNLFTIFGIILSFAIAIGGWIVIRELLDTQSNMLLSTTTYVSVDIPVFETEYVSNDTSLGLTEGEMISILRNWENTDTMRMHEPAAGQITMEQAFEAAREGMVFLHEQNILSPMIFHSPTRADLRQNIAPDQPFRPLRYSYWTVYFASEYFVVQFIINAVTGHVWRIEVDVIQRRPREFVSQVEIPISSDGLRYTLSTFLSMSEIDHDINEIQTQETIDELIPGVTVITPPLSPSHSEFIYTIDVGGTALLARYSFVGGNAAAIISVTGTRARHQTEWDSVHDALHFSNLSIKLVAAMG